MKSQDSLLLRIDAILAFVDLKVLLLIWILFDFYRNTALLGSGASVDHEKASVLLPYVWSVAGSPYIVWVPVVAVADIFVKRLIKSMLE